MHLVETVDESLGGLQDKVCVCVCVCVVWACDLLGSTCNSILTGCFFQYLNS